LYFVPYRDKKVVGVFAFFVCRFSGMSGVVGRMSLGFQPEAAPAGDVLPVRLGTESLRLDRRRTVWQHRFFDQPWCGRIRFAGLGTGDEIYSASLPCQPAFYSYTHTYFLVRHAAWLVIAFVWRPCWRFRCRWPHGKNRREVCFSCH
jgi:hypothetical protein